MKYEYKIVKSDSINSILNGSVDEKALNVLGEEGWKLVWIEKVNPITISLLFLSTTKLHAERTFYFRRVKK